MSDLRASRDHAVVLRAGLNRAARALLSSWRDAGSGAFDQEVLGPLDQETDRLARALADADARIDTELAALERAKNR